MFNLAPSDGSLFYVIPLSGKHEAVISRASFYSDEDTGTFAVFVFRLQNGLGITQVYDVEDFSNRSKVERFWDFIARIRELAAATGIDVGPINTHDEFKKAFTGAQVVIELEKYGDDSYVGVNIKRFAPSKLRRRKLTA